jgi:hypothetical protein
VETAQILAPISILFATKDHKELKEGLCISAANFQSQYDFREDFSADYVILRGKKSEFAFIRGFPMNCYGLGWPEERFQTGMVRDEERMSHSRLLD